jgi:hypothetical protein
MGFPSLPLITIGGLSRNKDCIFRSAITMLFKIVISK